MGVGGGGGGVVMVSCPSGMFLKKQQRPIPGSWVGFFFCCPQLKQQQEQDATIGVATTSFVRQHIITCCAVWKVTKRLFEGIQMLDLEGVQELFGFHFLMKSP